MKEMGPGPDKEDRDYSVMVTALSKLKSVHKTKNTYASPYKIAYGLSEKNHQAKDQVLTNPIPHTYVSQDNYPAIDISTWGFSNTK